MTSTTAQDRIQDRRELTAVLVRALERRHEVLDAIVDAADRDEATAAIATLLDADPDHAQAVLGMTFGRLTKDERRKTQAELDDLDQRLEWTARDRPASTGRTVELRVFTADDRDVFGRRCADQYPDWDADRVAAERAQVLSRIEEETAAWFVAEETSGSTVGLVFGEIGSGEVDVAIWIDPERRKQGFGTAVIKHARDEFAREFPGTVLVVRSPS
ncbi:GNAT family N-acetyltransferase [Skermania piniformis]|uniref:GNAT family N-acetyltransferase n=1 Tax=Skermania pinensis TaxID=39122 RepID=A0ABX8SAW6_9ACTN|nr:GNAT family N-acetyltransferase [Skermania piniformis]QXQ14591.1 GNAT family N-acetyltransferase [Skermania piniformis]